ncbi:MAG TPA: dihydrofolate reductase family protein [Cyclobacteriaceae bacterium]|jgi:dihydrofolate reductase
MRQVLLNLAVTIDGYIAGPNGEYDWCFTDNDYGLTAFNKRVDTFIMGRKTWEVSQQYLGDGSSEESSGSTIIVFSRTLKKAFDNVRIVNEDPVAFVKELKRQPGKDIWLYGGGEIVTQFQQANAIDEMHLSVHPLLLGDGIPLFGKSDRTPFELVESIPYPSGLVQLIYRRKSPGPWED